MLGKNLALAILGSVLLSAGIGCGDSGETSGTSGDTPLEDPEFTTKKVGNPTWEIADDHQFTGVWGDDPADPGKYIETLQKVLPPPGHELNSELGIGPGAAHVHPYDHEMGDNIEKLGYEDAVRFAPAEVMLPNAVLNMFMIVASEGSPKGSSPDFESGPILPSSLFPLSVEFSFYQGDVEKTDYAGGFFVPALDALTEPFDVEGHSHIPIFYGVWLQPEDPAGEYHWEVRLKDAENNGWTVERPFIVEE